MATRTPIPGTLSSASFLAAADVNNLPGGLIAVAVSVTSQTTITTIAPLTAMTLTVTPVSSTRYLRIEYVIPLSSTVANDLGEMQVLKDGVLLDAKFFTVSASLANPNGTAHGFALDGGPSVAAHTYSLSFGRGGTSAGTWNMPCNATQQALLAIYDVGPSF